MSIYVDPLKIWGGNDAPYCFRNKPSCHMYADTIDELHKMAIKIGMKLSWFQQDSRLPHYDLVSSKRIKAIKFGAIEHSFNQMLEFIQRKTHGVI